MLCLILHFLFCLFKQKTAYEMRINAWSADVCSSDLDIDVTDVRNVDDWLDRAHDAGHYLFASSGTSGKSSFLDQSMKDREYAVPACLAAFDLATPGYKPNHDRAVFTMMPEKGTHKMTEVSTLHFSRWARPGGQIGRASCRERGGK